MRVVDLGYMINHAMFQRNSRAGYVMKPLALRTSDKQLLLKRTRHFLDVTVSIMKFLLSCLAAHRRFFVDHLSAAASQTKRRARARDHRPLDPRPVRRSLAAHPRLDRHAVPPADLGHRQAAAQLLAARQHFPGRARRDVRAHGHRQDGRRQEQRVQSRVGAGAEPAVRLRRRHARPRVRALCGQAGGQGARGAARAVLH